MATTTMTSDERRQNVENQINALVFVCLHHNTKMMLEKKASAEFISQNKRLDGVCLYVFS